jgi:histidine phosphotransferase ChpT
LPNPTTPNLTALLGSRICHDLINPLGAIGNGIELLGLAGGAEGEEMTLVSDSVENATAKLKLLRLAFGDVAADQVVARADLLSTLDAVARGGRLSYSWSARPCSAPVRSTSGCSPPSPKTRTRH